MRWGQAPGRDDGGVEARLTGPGLARNMAGGDQAVSVERLEGPIASRVEGAVLEEDSEEEVVVVLVVADFEEEGVVLVVAVLRGDGK